MNRLAWCVVLILAGCADEGLYCDETNQLTCADGRPAACVATLVEYDPAECLDGRACPADEFRELTVCALGAEGEGVPACPSAGFEPFCRE